MTSSELGEFLTQEQNITLDSQQLQSLVEKYEISTAKQEGLLTLAGNKLSRIIIRFIGLSMF